MDTDGRPPSERSPAVGVSFDGTGLHSGAPCRVTLRRTNSPCLLRAEGAAAFVPELEVVRTDRGVAVRLGRDGPVVDLVEHLFSAFAAFGVRRGVEITVEGAEVPLVDGGARAFCAALRRLSPPSDATLLAVTRPAELSYGKAAYRFEPAGAVHVDVVAEFPHPLGSQAASWSGGALAFEEEFAPARTFGFAEEVSALRAAGRARHVDPAAVMVFDTSGQVLAPGLPAGDNEIARHKLLDLVGDFYVYGGPPRGRVFARRPGHGATHDVVRRALGEGILQRTGPGGV